ncbi:relaxase/mobilization nuclease domain-containing protein [Naasia lichenicola]|uniref:MobA/VirD2-like nuclease domain-containing protein n=1 Tax=Naasia lichenicola TaxID=2565933 RepID=A0A4S4FIE5_9MICO|nr:relaxase/mobilization nuclease domain-containing protein [Naasia lichenicola]THG30113.1 hypothetical protein E6C64_15885 [Naasia lichenicola]
MAGLLVYLAGDGRKDEHEEQHLVTGDEATVTYFGHGVLDRSTALAIAEELDQPRKAFGTEVTRLVTVQDPDGGEPIRARVPASVWHASLSLRAEEGQLSDEKWAAIADDFVDAMGFSETSGEAPCRWVAIRHGVSSNGNDHIHIAVSLVREDGTKASTHNDFRKAKNAARDLETRYGLQVLESRENGLGERGVKPGERARAERSGAVEVDSHRLERLVRGAAAASTTEADFLQRMSGQGVLIRPRFAAGRDDVVAGYSVALRPAKGDRPVWYGGGRLARDLTLPRLRDGWTDSLEAAAAAVEEWQSAFRNPWRYGSSQSGQQSKRPFATDRRELATEVAKLAQQLKAIPVDDRVAWSLAAREIAGVFAAWSTKLEPTPGKLAATARSLAKSAHLPAHEVKSPSFKLHSLSSVASLLALADPKMSQAAADAALIQQMGRAVVAILEAHRAAGEAQRAKQLADTMRTHVVALRDEIRAIQVAASDFHEAVAESLNRPVRSGNPIRRSWSDDEVARRARDRVDKSTRGYGL